MKQIPLAERFFAPQGEGLFTGTPMAFMRLVGCSVGKKVCVNCDTDFERMHKDLGGGLFTVGELLDWVTEQDFQMKHVCFTGGEPLDRDLSPLITEFSNRGLQVHIETSGTRCPEWLFKSIIQHDNIWLTVSPKPGWLDEMVQSADEIKVILQGLEDVQTKKWPTLDHAIEWARQGHLVYLQPANYKTWVHQVNLDAVVKAVMDHPELRVSVQLHKFLQTR